MGAAGFGFHGDEAVWSSGDRDGRRAVTTADDRAAIVASLADAVARISRDAPAPAAGGPVRMGAATSRVGSGARPPTPEDPAGPAGDAPGDPETVARTVCLRLLTAQARTRAELAAALQRRGIAPEVVERVLDRLTEVDLIDDAGYARAFVATKHRDRGLGRTALRNELRRKGIDGPAADRALESVDAVAERRRAVDLVAKRLDSAIFAGLPAARRRLLGLLARRGYSATLAASVVDDALRGYVAPVGPAEDEAFVTDWDEPTS